MMKAIKEHDVTQEQYTELALDETRTRFALLFADGVVLVRRCDGEASVIDLNPVQAMHLANAILAQSQNQGEQ